MQQVTKELLPCENSDRELWRETEGDYYAPSIHVTAQGGIGINVGGTVVVRSVREWHALVARTPDQRVIEAQDSDAAAELRRIANDHYLALGGPDTEALERIAARLEAHIAEDALIEALREGLESVEGAVTGVRAATVASCDCDHAANISPEPDAHELTCRYRVLYIAVSQLADARQALASLGQKQGGGE